mmetsp:Transcript_23972/g.60999  ORF Transcript_23972/g.60999 Transcript_23972/m.60999 type:complete len:227 (+) Transcript_23972:811-1491(+)
MREQAVVVRQVGLQGQDACAGVLDVVFLAEPVVRLRPHALALEEPIHAPVQGGVCVKPDELVVLGKLPDLELPPSSRPLWARGLCVLRPAWRAMHLHFLQGPHLDTQRLEGHLNVCAILEVCGVRQKDRGVRAEPLQRAGERERPVEVVLARARLVVRHHHVGTLLVRRLLPLLVPLGHGVGHGVGLIGSRNVVLPVQLLVAGNAEGQRQPDAQGACNEGQCARDH